MPIAYSGLERCRGGLGGLKEGVGECRGWWQQEEQPGRGSNICKYGGETKDGLFIHGMCGWEGKGLIQQLTKYGF